MFTTTQLKEVLESAQYITSQLKNLQQQKYLANWFTEEAKNCSEESNLDGK